jgi:hypothetical protein
MHLLLQRAMAGAGAGARPCTGQGALDEVALAPWRLPLPGRSSSRATPVAARAERALHPAAPSTAAIANGRAAPSLMLVAGVVMVVVVVGVHGRLAAQAGGTCTHASPGL